MTEQVDVSARHGTPGLQTMRTDSALGACLLGGTRVRLVISLDPGTGAQARPPTGAGAGVLK
jgi:hypothetical protein